MKPLFDLLSHYAPLSDDSKELLPTLLIPRDVDKNEIIHKAGQVCRHIYFIESGLIRIYYNLSNKEVTSWLLKENDIFVEVEGFFGQKPSRKSIMSLEKGRIIGISYDQLQELCRRDPSFLWNRVYITEAYYQLSERMHMDIFMKRPIEKYHTLMKNSPDFFERVPLKYLYSYLGMSKATFDRMRKEYPSYLKEQNR